MIVEIKVIIQQNQSASYIQYIKEQMIRLYQQLSKCEDLPTNVFLNIIQYNPIFVDVDEKYNVRGSITVVVERKMLRGGKFVAHIEDLVVDAAHRGQGIGKKLLTYAIEFAKNIDCYKVILNCTSELVPFYETNGFQQKNMEMRLYFE